MNSERRGWSGKTWFRIILILISLGILGAVIGIAVYQGKISDSDDAAAITLGNYGTVKKTKVSKVSKVFEENRQKEYRQQRNYLDYFSFDAGSQTFVVYISTTADGSSYSSNTAGSLKDQVESIRSSLLNEYLDHTEINNDIISIVPDEETPQITAENISGYLSDD